MNTKSQGEKEEARGETVEVLLAQLKDTLDKQFHAVDGLDQKAGMVLGSGSLVVALIAVLASGLLQGLIRANTVSPYLQLGFVIGAVLYIGIIYCVVRAFRVTTYYLPLQLDPQEIRKGYLGLSKAQVREQLLANYIEYCSANSTILEEKARWVQISLYVLAADTAYLTTVVIAGTLLLAT